MLTLYTHVHIRIPYYAPLSPSIHTYNTCSTHVQTHTHTCTYIDMYRPICIWACTAFTHCIHTLHSHTAFSHRISHTGPPGTNYAVMKKAFEEGWGGVIAKTVSLDSSKVCCCFFTCLFVCVSSKVFFLYVCVCVCLFKGVFVLLFFTCLFVYVSTQQAHRPTTPQHHTHPITQHPHPPPKHPHTPTPQHPSKTPELLQHRW